MFHGEESFLRSLSCLPAALEAEIIADMTTHLNNHVYHLSVHVKVCRSFKFTLSWPGYQKRKTKLGSQGVEVGKPRGRSGETEG